MGRGSPVVAPTPDHDRISRRIERKRIRAKSQETTMPHANDPRLAVQPLCAEPDDLIVWSDQERTWCFRHELEAYLGFMPQTYDVLPSGSPAWHRHEAHRAV